MPSPAPSRPGRLRQVETAASASRVPAEYHAPERNVQTSACSRDLRRTVRYTRHAIQRQAT